MSEPLYIAVTDDGLAHNCHTWAGGKVGLWPADYARAVSDTLAQAGAVLTPYAAEARYALTFRKVPTVENEHLYENRLVVRARARRVDVDRPIYFEVREADTGNAVWHSLQAWPLYVAECALCCDDEAQVHFSEIAQAIAAWDGTPNIVQPDEVIGMVSELTTGSASMSDLIDVVPPLAPETAGTLPHDIAALRFVPALPDDYVRQQAGRIAPGESYEEVRLYLQTAGRGFGIIRIEPFEDTVIYHLGNATDWVDAYEAKNGWPATTLLSAKAAALRAAETGLWRQGLSTEFEVDESMYEDECVLIFDRASKTVLSNTCPKVESSFDPEVVREDALIIKVTGFPNDEAMIPDYDIVAWLRFADGKLVENLGPYQDANGQLSDISELEPLPPLLRFKRPLLRN